MFIVITVDKWLRPNATEHPTFASALYQAKKANKDNPNAISIEISSRTNGALLQKVK